MGWTESKRMSSRELVQAIKDLRIALGETQEAFAARLNLSKRAIANYEKDRRPTGAVLAELARVASKADLGKLSRAFMWELGEDLRLAEIKGGTRSYDPSEGRGYILVQFEDAESRRAANAFFNVIARFQAGTASEKKKAGDVLLDFARAAHKLEMTGS